MSTRDIPADLTNRVQQLGWTLDVLPFITVRLNEDQRLVQQATDMASRPLLVLFTSRYAVESVARWCPELPSAWSVACLKGATQEAVLHHWPGAVVVAAGGDAHALAIKIAAMGEERAMVFFCGNQRLDHLPHALREAGFSFEELVVYETSETAHKISKPYDAILFFSPSAVRSYFSLNVPAEHAVLFAIGETTAGYIRNYSKNKVIPASQPTTEAMIDAVADYWKYEE